MTKTEVVEIFEATARAELEKRNGQVWDTAELTKEFIPSNFLAPFVMVTRKSDGVKGMLMFTHMPRFYFKFEEVG